MFVLLLCTDSLYASTLYFSAPPREGSEIKSREFYKPVVEALSFILDQPVEFKSSENFYKYGLEMRKGGYDIVFDGPHFAAWRMRELGHRPVVVLPGNLRFLVLTKKDNQRISNKDSLIAKKICGPSIPNLAALMALDMYKESIIRQPILEAVPGGMKGAYNAFKEGRCDGVVLRDSFYMKKIPEAEKEQPESTFKVHHLR